MERPREAVQFAKTLAPAVATVLAAAPLLLGLFAILRRFGGATRPDSLALAAFGLLTLVCGWAARGLFLAAEFRLTGWSWVWLLPVAAALSGGLALTHLPPSLADVALVGLLLMSEGAAITFWLRGRGAAVESSSPSADRTPASPLNAGNRTAPEFATDDFATDDEELPALAADQWQRTCRVHRDGRDLVEGLLRISFAAGQRQHQAHLLFEPAFATTPEVSLEALDGEVRPRVAELRSYGLRIELKRTDAREPAEVQIAIVAHAALPEVAGERGA